MKKADASGARLAVIIGDDEADAGNVTVKDLRAERPQQTVPLTQAAALIEAWRMQPAQP